MKTQADKPYTRTDVFKGGPGLDGYAYLAAVYCVDCARRLVFDTPNWRWNESDFSDSDIVPQPIFFGESDTAQHCEVCGEFLYGERE
jgi:ribosomal protein S27E